MRLFFAIACPTGSAALIENWRNSLGLDGQPVRAANLHVTLAFIGQQPSEKLPLIAQLAESVKAECFTLELDHLGYWSAGGILHLAPNKPPEALLYLAEQLQQALICAGITVDQGQYRPHLTLARHCRQAIAVSAPVFSWNVEEFGLYLSQHEADQISYKPLAIWRLPQPS